MNTFKNILKATMSVAFILLSLLSCVKREENTSRKIENFNADWRFINDNNLNIETLESEKVKWQNITIPHDWTAKTPYNQTYRVTDTTPALGGIGWYKKEFKIAETDKNKQISVEFNGVYNNSKVWINGHYLGFWPYGYTAFSYNLTPFLKFGNKPNELVVRVDRTAFLDSRWYAGAGIYRNVNLIETNPIHIPKWGVKITTPKISNKLAEVVFDVSVAGKINSKNQDLKVIARIKDFNNNMIASAEVPLKITKDTSHVSGKIKLNNPKLWSPKNPNLYQLETKIIDGEKELDLVNTTFGVRYFKYDANTGFSLNGEKTMFKGVCLHHCAGALGAAVPDEVWLQRLLKLKEGGVNAIRTAHNPASKRFLEMCDSLGFLVQEEIFDELDYPKDKRKNYNNDSDTEKPYEKGYTEYFQEHGEKDLKSMLLRDQNHPSIIMWSVGNELEWTYPRYGKSSGYWNSGKKYYYDEPPISIPEMKKLMEQNPPRQFELAKTVQRLADFVKTIDTTRAVTANLVIPTVAHFSGYTDALDIVGYSYRACVYDYGHKNYPDKMIYGSENWANYVEWKSVEENPHIPGIFLWAGIHYMGETSNAENRGSESGLLDYAGLPTPRWYMFKSVWNPEPMVYMNTYPLVASDYKLKGNKVIYKEKDLWRKRRWGWQKFNNHWNYKENEMIAVEVFTNCPSVELFLDGKSMGIQKLKDFEDHLVKFAIPYQKGALKVVGNCDDKEVNYQIKTALAPAKVKLTILEKSRSKKEGEMIHVLVELQDENGNLVTNNDIFAEVNTEGNAKILAIENGSNRLNTSGKTRFNKGKFLIYVKLTKPEKQSKLNLKLPNGYKNSVNL